MANLRYGSKGQDVTALQQQLKSLGYLDATPDGIYGDKTQAAVTAYQRANGIEADGIYGPKTQAAMNGTAKNAYEYNKPNYMPSDSLKTAQQQLSSYEAQKPGPYGSEYANQIQKYLDQIENGKPFSYDFNADALYNQYKDRYMEQGKQAMMDTVGQAAALTGGYGNSYGATAGNQAYQKYLQGLNDIIPELYDRAYNRYRDEKQDVYDKLALVQNLDERDYGRYRDSVSDYLSERDYLYGKQQDLSNEEYSRYQDRLNNWYNDRNYGYTKDMDAQEYKQWQDEFAYQKAQDALAQQNWEKEYALSKQSKSSSRSSGSSKSSKNGNGSDENASSNFSGNQKTATAINMLEKSPLSKNKELAIQQMYDEGKLTREETEYLMDYYGF